MTTTTYTVPSPYGDVPVTITERGHGHPVLLLHGGAGPDSVAGLADLLAARLPVQVLTPVNPGFGGTPRPDRLDSARKLGDVYARLLGQLGLAGATVIGSSIGGWIAAEVALAATGQPSQAGRVGQAGRVVLLDAAGLDSTTNPPADFFSLSLDQVAEFSYAHPDEHRIDLSALTDAQKAIAAGNRAALLVYGGPGMADPTLSGRLAGLTAPTLVVWGEADRMMTPAYGKEYAAAIPGASFVLIPDAGHLPQLEAPEALLAVLGPFIATGR